MTQAQSSPVILMVDDNPNNLNVLRATLEREGYKIAAATSGESALKIVSRTQPALILLDIIMPGLDGFEVCRRFKANASTAEIPIIFITAREDTESVVEGFQAGGIDYVIKPFKAAEVLARVGTHLTIHRLNHELREKNLELQAQIEERKQAEQARNQATDQLSFVSQREAQRWGIKGFIGRSQTIGKILDDVNRLQTAGTVSVLITGESGTGKELIARAIHFGGERTKRPFVPVNCSAIPKALAESELFGHVKGAFTGATADRKGHFEFANGGTLFLDEIGDMPLELQAKLLRVLEDGQITPVGGDRTRRVDVRVLAATNINLEEKIANGQFRADLYYRLAQFVVVVPPLRDRPEDIPLLAEHFLNLFARDVGVEKPTLSEATLDALTTYPFPGNVRELKNITVRALIESDGDEIQPHHLHFISVPATPIQPINLPDTDTTLDEIPLNLKEAEIYLIKRALNQADGNITKAAELLGIDRKTIYRKLGDAKPQIE